MDFFVWIAETDVVLRFVLRGINGRETTSYTNSMPQIDMPPVGTVWTTPVSVMRPEEAVEHLNEHPEDVLRMG